jgi:hypothetical protein
MKAKVWLRIPHGVKRGTTTPSMDSPGQPSWILSRLQTIQSLPIVKCISQQVNLDPKHSVAVKLPCATAVGERRPGEDVGDSRGPWRRAGGRGWPTAVAGFGVTSWLD